MLDAEDNSKTSSGVEDEARVVDESRSRGRARVEDDAVLNESWTCSRVWRAAFTTTEWTMMPVGGLVVENIETTRAQEGQRHVGPVGVSEIEDNSMELFTSRSDI